MNLFRFAGRALLGSYFVGHGVAAIRDPEASAADAEPVLAKVADLTERFCPASCRRFVPSSATSFVRLHGALEVVGGVLMALGFARRLGAGLLIVGQGLRLAGKPSGLDAGLLGAVVIEALDTQGQPSLAWRLGQGKSKAVAQAKRAERTARRQAKLARQAAQLKVVEVQRRVTGALD